MGPVIVSVINYVIQALCKKNSSQMELIEIKYDYGNKVQIVASFRRWSRRFALSTCQDLLLTVDEPHLIVESRSHKLLQGSDAFIFST